MKRYSIWNKIDPIITPIGEVCSPEQWIARYPVAGLANITVVCAAGETNGSFFSTLGSMVDIYTRRGCDFSACETSEDRLNVIEAFLDAEEAEAAAKAEEAANTPSTDERIAAALEAQVLMSLPDEEETV